MAQRRKAQRGPGDAVIWDGWGNEMYLREHPRDNNVPPQLLLLHAYDCHSVSITPSLARTLKPLIDKLAAG